MLDETGPEFTSESDSHTDNSPGNPENIEFQNTSDSKDENNSASDDSLKKLRDTKNGERQDAQPTGQPEAQKDPDSEAKDRASDTSEELNPMPATYIPKKGDTPNVPIPKTEETAPIKEQNEEPTEETEKTPPNVPIPQDLKTSEKDPQLSIRTGNATWKNQDSDTSDEIQYPTEEPPESAQGEPAPPTSSQQEEPQPPLSDDAEATPDQSIEPPQEQKAGLGQRFVGRIKRALDRSSETPTPDQPEPEQPTQEEILQGKIDERRTAFATAKDVSSIRLNNGQLQGVKFDPEKSNPFVVRGADGNNRYLSEEEFNKILKSDIARGEKQSESLPQVQPEPEQKTPEPQQPSPTEIKTNGEPQMVESPQPAEQPTSETSQSGQKPIEAEVQERYSNLKPGDKFHIGKTEYTVDKFGGETVGDEKIVRVRLLKPDGSTYYRYDHEIKAELEKQIITERKEAVKAEKEQAKAEKKERESKYKEAKSTSKEYLDQKVASLREQLENPKFNRATSKQPITLDGKQYQYVKYAPELSNPYLIRDGNGNNRYLSKDEINRALRNEASLESKVKIENLKPESKPSGRSLEEVSKGTNTLLEIAESNRISKFLLDSAKSFLHARDPRGKNLPAYLTGVAIGGASNAALVLSGPAFPAVAWVRSLAVSGGILAASKGVNLFLKKSLTKIAEITGVVDKKYFTQSAIEMSQKAGQAEAAGNKEESIAIKNNWSKEQQKKAGNKIERKDYWAWTEDLARAALINETLKTIQKYSRLDKIGKDMGAGIGTGSLVMTGIFAAFPELPENILENIGKGITAGKDIFVGAANKAKDLVTAGPSVPSGLTGEPVTPTPGPSGEAPSNLPPTTGPESTPAPEQTPQPTQPGETPGSETPDTESDLPTSPEKPADFAELGSNPEFTNTIGIQQGNTVSGLFADADFDPYDPEIQVAHLSDPENYQMLKEMHDNVATTGVEVAPFPTIGELPSLLEQANSPNPQVAAAARARITESLHWIPTGGNINILTPKGLEQARILLNRGG